MSCEYELQLPDGYRPSMDIFKTEKAIKLLKDEFEDILAKTLALTRVSAPLFVHPESGLNDNLSGVERAVSFDIKGDGSIAEVVHSLAKWKRFALKRYGMSVGQGLYTDMNAIRRDEVTDNIHSLYVDQWDWEKVITREERTVDMLKIIVKQIYGVFRSVEAIVCGQYPMLTPKLPESITFLTTQELEDRYPDLSSSEREKAAVKEYGAIFLMQIGGVLRSGKPHDGRAPDYDDWQLNGDIIFYYPLLDRAFEVSSMGIRVDEESLKRQLAIAGCTDREQLPFQKALLNGELPLTVGGGIGQSRLCMFFLNKAHIGEVQASLWPDEMVEECAAAGIPLL